MDSGLTRRRLLERAAIGAGSVSLAPALLTPTALAARATRRRIGLPSPRQVRADFQRMVDFGPRLTGSEPHNRFLTWLEQEFTAAGCRILPSDGLETNRWEVGSFGLDVLDGPGSGPVKIATYFPRSQETPAAGMTG